MTLSTKELFYSKIMLFGEYAIILGSMGLTIPFSHFNAQLSFINRDSYTDLDFAQMSNQQLRAYVQYLRTSHDHIDRILRMDDLMSDINRGLFLESSIPESYGLGSSGALVAAIYRQYGINRADGSAHLPQPERIALKETLAGLERFFHGTSSGIDPLICYMNHPLCIENEQSIVSVSLPLQHIASNDAIFIVNTGNPGKTAPLVRQFLDRLTDDEFKDSVHNQYIPLTHGCIESLIDGRLETMFSQLYLLSTWQLLHFEAMIPEAFRIIWDDGLQRELFTMKLCGSGGGGYALGFTRHFTQTRSYFKQHGMDLIPVFQVKE